MAAPREEPLVKLFCVHLTKLREIVDPKSKPASLLLEPTGFVSQHTEGML